MKELTFTRLSEHLLVHHGAINVGILRDRDQLLLIDFGEGSVRSAVHMPDVKVVLFTHHHRDQASGITPEDNVDICVPAQERMWFEDVERYWDDPTNRWHIYNFHPHNLMLAESIPVTHTYEEGDVIKWGSAKVSVLDTPGHTDGSVSYIIEVDGKIFAFCGDLIYDKGQIWELYSLQKGDTTTDYHGFLGSRKELKQSLLKLRAVDPTALIPSHGNIIYEPKSAIDALIERLDKCYDRYVAISALRYYFPDMFAEFSGSSGHMPIRSGKAMPNFLRHYGTSWFITSRSKEIFVIDCGSLDVVRNIQELVANGEITGVGGLWVTHYHDDHVDAIPEFQKVFKCPIYVSASFADILRNPHGYRMPCISPSVVEVSHCTKDGDSWAWNEFKMSAYHFPGQTYYHGGLLVEGQGARMFFAGDSFTMAGIDDYCSGNRNWLGRGVGFDRCLELMQILKPTHIFNCHVDTAFDFTNEELEFMRSNLAQRERIYGELFPWDSPNYGMDEHWVRCYPYEQSAQAGETVTLRVDITNHSASERCAVCRPILPRSWNVELETKSVIIPPKNDGHITFSFAIPRDATPKRVVVPVEVTYDGRPLGQFREAVLVVNARV